MSINSRTPTWPYIAMVAALFLGSMLATQTYRSPESEPVSINIHGPSQPAALEVPQVEPYAAQLVVDPSSPPLADLATPATVARIAPPVADRVVADVIPVEPKRTRESPPEPLASSPTRLMAGRIREFPRLDQLPRLRRRRMTSAPSGDSAWPYPRSLAEQLELLGQADEAKDWAASCLAAINQLTRVDSHLSAEATAILATLHRLVLESKEVAKQAADPASRGQVLRAGYALQRRETVWQAVQGIAQVASTRFHVGDSPENMGVIIEQARRRLVDRRSESWITFLGLNEASGVVDSPQSNSSDMRRHGKKILGRIRNASLTEAQSKVLEDETLKAYIQHLRRWATEPVDYRRLLVEVEEFEQSRGERMGEIFAGRIASMQWSELEQERRLARHLATYYRNANLRLSLSEEFVNRLLPAPSRFYHDVDDFVVRAHVIGVAQTSADLKLKCIPAPNRWQLALEARGYVASETSSTRGPVTTFQDGLSEYLVRKHLTVDPRDGVLASPSESAVESESDLVGLRTDFDGVPLLNLLVRSLALQQYDSSAGEAQYVMEDKVASQASQRVDEEIDGRLDEIKSRLEKSVLEPLRALNLRPVTTDMQTLEDGLVARFRLADRDQLAAFTPRPREPDGSMISVQLHESAINNAAEGLALAGQRIELTDLFRKISRLSNAANQPAAIPDELPRGVYVTFVDQDPLRVRLADGRMHLSIDVESLETEERTWGRFGIDVYYQPDHEQIEANLVRDGVIEVRGEMSFRERIPLRAVFGKVFAKSRSITLLNDHLRDGARLQGLTVSQFVLQDGWLGLAISRQLVAEKPGETVR